MMDEEDRIRDLVAAYVLGAVTPEEDVLVERHLVTCASCRQEERELRAVERVLPLLAGGLDPPPALKARLMAAVAADAPARRMEAPRAEPAGPRPGVVMGGRSAAAPRRVRRVSAWQAVLAVAAVCALVALGAGLWRALNGPPQPTQVTAMRGTPARPSIKGKLMYYKGDNRLVLTLQGLKKTTPGHVYELWLVRTRGGAITGVKGLKVFRSTTGKGRLVVSGRDLRGYNLTGLTLEHHFSPDKPTPPIYAEGKNPAA